MKRRKDSRKRILTALLCWALCAADIMPAGMTVWANEQAPESVESYDDISEVADEDGNGDSIEDSGDDHQEQESEPEQEETDTDENLNDTETEEDAPDNSEHSEDEEDSEYGDENGDVATEILSEDNEIQEAENGSEELSGMSESATTNDDAEIKYRGSNQGIQWTIDVNGKLTVTGNGDYNKSQVWGSYKNEIKSAEIKVTGMKDASYMFQNCSNLVTIDLKEFDTSNITNMQAMFEGCRSLESLDLSNFKTANVTNMKSMFHICSSLVSLDLSNLNTENVENMALMFASCTKLNDLNLEGLKTNSVTDMSEMFEACSGLSSLNVGSFDTSKVTTMYLMFSGCSGLDKLDLRSFNTGEVNNMKGMFSNCYKLASLDLSSFDTQNVTTMSGMFSQVGSTGKGIKLDLSNFNTGKVTDMSNMFAMCKTMAELNVGGFDTGKVTDMHNMFQECQGLTELDLSSFNTASVTDMSIMFDRCSSLKSLNLSGFDLSGLSKAPNGFMTRCSSLHTIYTPYNLKTDYKVPLPKLNSTKVSDVGTWYDVNNNRYTELPMGLAYSILIEQNKKPNISANSTISVQKVKTTYVVGDTVSVDDLTVTYYGSDGSVKKLTKDQYTTNADKVNEDMSTPGIKTLTVSYIDPDKNITLTADITITVTLGLTDANTAITLPEGSMVYNGYAQRPIPIVKARTDKEVQESGTEITLVEDTDYTVSYQNNTIVGMGTVVITGMGIYSGTVSKTFEIAAKPLTVKVKDMNLEQGGRLPGEFEYEVKGLVPADEGKGGLMTISFTFKDSAGGDVTDLESIGKANVGTIYYIVPNVVLNSTNYKIEGDAVGESSWGKLTVTEEWLEYRAAFDMMGHGTSIEPISGIKAGSLITEPEVPEAEGYVFSGWYKDKTFASKQKWNFATDTVQADITLYACWIVKGTEEYSGLQFSIQDIQDQYYTGSAIKPTVYVYAADGVTLLKSGKDYTIKYAQNTNAVKVDETTDQSQGGTALITDFGKAGKEERKSIDGTFNENLPYVIITGKGNYSGSIYKNFQILPAKLSAEDGNIAAGFTLKYSDQLVTNAKKDQNPFSSVKYKKAMKAGTDFTVELCAVDAYDSEGKPAFEDGVAWSSKTTPVIPKGYYGAFTMTVTGKGNYTGSVTKDIIVTDKDHLMKNAAISIGKNQKSRPYANGKAVTLTPGWYDTAAKKYYKMEGDCVKEDPEKNANDIFTVKAGKTYLVRGEDYEVSYTDNIAVGTATMTITGKGDYVGSKSVTFKITGTAFNAKNVIITTYDAKKMTLEESAGCLMPSMIYTGRAVTQNKVILMPKSTTENPNPDPLVYGTHYTISYKNNVKKGTATMIFTAKPESGYTGSLTKTFKIEAADITKLIPDANIIEKQAIGTGEAPPEGWKLKAAVSYVKGGVKLSDVEGIDMNTILTNDAGIHLTMGTDYTVKYKNNAAVTISPEPAASKMPCMTITGKGNYKGTLTIYFTIKKAEISAEQIIVSQIVFNPKAKDTYAYKPGIKVIDSVSGKTLSAGKNKDYEISYEDNTQEDVKNYINGDSDSAVSPMAVITMPESGSYETTEIKVPIPVYGTKLTGSNLYIIVDEGDPKNITYTGNIGDDNKVSPAKPEVTVYYGDANDIKRAKAARETNEEVLTNDADNDGYSLIKLDEDVSLTDTGDYTVIYGANNVAGKNKGSIIITGIPKKYGGSVTVKFTIKQRCVYL